MRLFLDTESYSTVRIERGLDQYMNGARCLIATYARDEGDVQCWDVTKGQPMPDDLSQALADPDVQLVAHNVQFDRTLLTRALDTYTPIERWFCTMACAYAHALPGSLDTLGPVLGLPAETQKLADGKKLIQQFCVPFKGEPRCTPESHPEDWQRFIEYAIQDVAALRELHKRIPKHNYINDGGLWHLDQEINERGFAIDTDMCNAAIDICEKLKADLDTEVDKLTNGEVTAATQRARVLSHMVTDYGFFMIDLKSDTIRKMLAEDDLTPDARRLLEIRLESAMTSQAKYKRAVERVGNDGRMRYTLQYAGAGRTGRWAGRGFQPHNMPRPKSDPEYVEDTIVPAILDGTLPQKVTEVNQACADALRSTIIAAPGHELLVGDWSNIEGRVLAWIAGEQWKLKAFEDNDAGTGPDLYVLLYAKSFGIKVEDVSGKQRQMGKGMELSLGYGGGVGAFGNVAASYGLDLAELGRQVPDIVPSEILKKAEQAWERAFLRGEDQGFEPEVYIACDALKQVYRRANPEIMELWWSLERACKFAIDNPGSVHHCGRCKIWRSAAWLIIELPSGRRLLYAQPKVERSPPKIVREVYTDPQTGEITVTEHVEEREKFTITYMGAKAKQWRRDRTYGGKLVENVTQAIANDVLRASLLRADAEGYPQILHVHDEQVAETPEGLFELDDFLRLMEEPLPWSKGLPLKAAGYVSKRYKKD